MNASNISLRGALARTAAPLEAVALKAAALDVARRRADKKTRKATLLVKKVFKLMKAERTAKKAERKESESPEPEKEESDVVLQQYKRFGDEYLEKKQKFDAGLLRGDLTRKKHKVELDSARLEMAEKQLRFGWVGWKDPQAIETDYWIERQAECMAWYRSGDQGEEKYWSTLALAAESIVNGNCDEAVKGFLSVAGEILSDWAETIGTD
ncbi:hypothetical protein KCU77_g1476, partial [Aureobasidium melanogenum]